MARPGASPRAVGPGARRPIGPQPGVDGPLRLFSLSRLLLLFPSFSLFPSVLGGLIGLTREIARVEKRRGSPDAAPAGTRDTRRTRQRRAARMAPSSVAALSPSAVRVSAPDCFLMRCRSYDRATAFPCVELCNVPCRA